jgi:hypothetical protein
LLLVAAGRLTGAPSAAAVSTFDSCIQGVEARLARQHLSPDSFLAAYSDSEPESADRRLRRGEPIIEKLTTSTTSGLSGAMLHQWRGTAFAPAAKSVDFERLLRDVGSYPQTFSPQVLQAWASANAGDRMQLWMRIRQKHAITVVLDTAYDVAFGQLDAQHGYSISRSTRIDEIGSPGTSAERPLNADEEHGFLWRLNSYWSWEERDAGLYMQIENVSLTRSVPFGLGWAIRPYVESIPRESLEFTLRSVLNALSGSGGSGNSGVAHLERTER